jgi:hypothetical protein
LKTGADEFASATTNALGKSIDPKNVPTLVQLQDHFRDMFQRCRHAALRPNNSAFAHTLATIASYLVPSNIRTIDEIDTLQKVRRAQKYLDQGQLEECLAALEALEGTAKQEVAEFVALLKSRVDVLNLVNVLSEYNQSSVKGII